jgi:PPK2 family polyphosphate:nucleotide phosphotransferase
MGDSLKIKSEYRIKAGSKVKLSKLKTDSDGGFKSKEQAAPVLVKHRDRLSAAQEVLYASGKKALLIVLQGMDAAGKDGTISHIFSGVNPQGCDVASFKVPTPEEEKHDFLWRVHKAVPQRGMIGIFNRSHYEDVLSPRVHKLVTEKMVKQRLAEINQFEASLAENDVAILKFYLHISEKEQKRRLQSRLDTPDKHWKLSLADFNERLLWPQYMEAYENLLSATSTEYAPWFVIPADVKWYRNVAISEILAEAIEGLKLKYPKPTVDASKIKL